MYGIERIASYIPEEQLEIGPLAEAVSADPEFVRTKLGVTRLPVLDSELDTSDLAVAALNRLMAGDSVARDEIGCLIVCTQNPDGEGLPHTSALVQAKAGLPSSVAAFDISLGCSGYVYGIAAVTGFLDATGMEKGVLITADPYSKIVNRNDRDTALLFGDAATATLVSRNGPWKMIASDFGTDGAGAENLVKRDGQLSMNGRQVFNFTLSRVPDQIRKVVADAELRLDDIQVFVLHQGSRYIVESIGRRLGVPAARVPVAIEETGNTVSSSIPLILETVLESKNNKHIVISGFGVGLSWGSAVLTRNSSQ